MKEENEMWKLFTLGNGTYETWIYLVCVWISRPASEVTASLANFTSRNAKPADTKYPMIFNVRCDTRRSPKNCQFFRKFGELRHPKTSRGSEPRITRRTGFAN